MLYALIIISLAAVWGWLLQRIAQRGGGEPLTAAYPASVQQPYLSLWIIGFLAAALLIWSVR